MKRVVTIQRLYALWDDDKKITAIKELRELTGASIKETHDAFAARDIASVFDRVERMLEQQIQWAKKKLKALEELP